MKKLILVFVTTLLVFSNYYQLNDAFEFELSVEELNEYINSLEQ